MRGINKLITANDRWRITFRQIADIKASLEVKDRGMGPGDGGIGYDQAHACMPKDIRGPPKHNPIRRTNGEIISSLVRISAWQHHLGKIETGLVHLENNVATRLRFGVLWLRF